MADTADAHRFRMNSKRRGNLVIINQTEFKSQQPRLFSDMDLAKIYTAFAGLGFNIVKYTNLTGQKIESALAAGKNFVKNML